LIRITLFALAVATSALAQSSGIVTGTITDSATQLPLNHALIGVTNGTRDVTGADGSFRLPDLPAGDLKIHIAAAGYRALDATVHLSDDEHVSSFFAMHPMARVTGRIVDKESGVGIVRDLQLGPVNARGAGLFVNPATSDKGGAFHFDSLDPGDYTLSSDSLAGDAQLVTDLSQKPKSKSAYGTYVYPETIHLAEGEQKLVEIHIAQTEPHSASVSIEYPHGYENLPSRLTYGTTYADGAVVVLPLGTVTPGSFRIDGLISGSYRLYATAGEGAATAFGSVAVSIADHDVDDLVIKLQPGVTLTGSIRMLEDGAVLPAKTSGLAAVVSPADGLWFGATGQAINIADYRFHSESLPQGQFEADLVGLPDGYAVTSVLFDGGDTLGRPISLFGSGEITFIVTSKAANITGFVRDANQNPLQGVSVELQHEPPFATGSVGRIVSGASGEFRFRNLAPGRYSIEGASPIDLQPGQTAAVSVTR
jgi:hypothetical protein